MVDLRATLRPLVDEPATERRPVAELAERADQARRRRVRRRSTAAGLAAATVVAVVAGSLVTRDDPAQVTTTDAPSSTVDAPAPSTTGAPASTTTVAPAPPNPTTTAAPVPPPTEGPASELAVSETTTSSWDRGHCVQVRVENTTGAPVEWSIEHPVDGGIATIWNARVVADDGAVATFAGDDWNATLAPAEWTTFGLCLDT